MILYFCYAGNVNIDIIWYVIRKFATAREAFVTLCNHRRPNWVIPLPNVKNGISTAPVPGFIINMDSFTVDVPGLVVGRS